MEGLINYLCRFGQLNDQQIELVKNKVKIIHLNKGDSFSEAGKIARQVAFVSAGILRVFYYNNKDKEITRYFIDEQNFAVDLHSFSDQVPSSEYIQAVMDCRLLVFTAADLKELSQTIVGWETLINKISATSLLEKVNRISPMLGEDASSRYANFLERFPTLANRIPLSFLASYLGITQSSLSRIRRNS
ncbi:Crp/Fnr family transcriptional regulator [Pseudoflavitalea sp. G-6-1-2]|uniref:Crp/Fnr family transcriptional regulator n=1 Tax=Pseudoflavitalea sp. G-6-1-2 TaxID=2728841 RepID=UPI00146C90E7|nr:Crp/Fnr family transcriptional regulator [Pseudoflavitalea sp. G-6-1-2]NML23996.1 Crp/Fnr family transcriptional regulator [Pseudoflavitalea sp. G-6-1-2]